MLNFRAEKCTHTRTPSNGIFDGPYNKSAFNTVRFDRNPFARSLKEGTLMISNLALLFVIFRVTARQAWQ